MSVGIIENGHQSKQGCSKLRVRGEAPDVPKPQHIFLVPPDNVNLNYFCSVFQSTQCVMETPVELQEREQLVGGEERPVHVVKEPKQVVTLLGIQLTRYYGLG